MYASPEYIQKAGKPLMPDDLAKHSWLGFVGHEDFSTIELMHHIENSYCYQPPYRMRFNDLNSLVCHVQEGLGVAVLPDLEVQHLVKSEKLIKLLPEWQLNRLPLYALTIDRKQSYKVQRVLKALKEFFS
ncbi:LysR substrate-binding domain-containing protein [Endozoicomonas gorgoniicola]|uniref:LysR substrate-binding domain-containing protein n=1 Tax=Endozoicomonas gorgoniicola TaxID=1234144 RepID=A0ABT3MSW0_9GAMM|nr:LysR substrate-binding domain-containing protein [Endozoicomonas gorgoniicola]MCW7552452.1 LysR substrate-binding domain-containing protein [Endozoicomonas gorgoniicola]